MRINKLNPSFIKYSMNDNLYSLKNTEDALLSDINKSKSNASDYSAEKIIIGNIDKLKFRNS